MTMPVRILALVSAVLLALPPAVGAGFWSDVKDSAKKAWTEIKGAGRQAPETVAEDAKEAWEGVKETGGKAGDAISREVKQAPQNVKKGLEAVKGAD